MFFKNFKSQKGTAFVELAMVSLILVLMFCGGMEMGNMIHAQMSVVRIAREGARETALTSDTDTGYLKARECSDQSLGGSSGTDINITKDDTNVTCTAAYAYKTLVFLSKNGIGKNRTLKATAIYAWWDKTK